MNVGRSVSTLWCLAAVLVGAGPEASASEWADERQVGPFVVQSVCDLSPYEPLLDELLRLEQELRRVLGVRPCRRPIGVVMLDTQRQHRQYLAARYPDAPYRRALFVRENGCSTVFVYRHPEMAIDLRHECTHALVNEDLGALPLWLDEGLAEYFEVPAAERATGHPHREALRQRVRRGRLPALAELARKQQLNEFAIEDYQGAWAWVHFMLHGPRPATEAFWSFLAERRRDPRAEPLSERIERLAPNPRELLASHLLAWERLALRRGPPDEAHTRLGRGAGP